MGLAASAGCASVCARAEVGTRGVRCSVLRRGRGGIPLPMTGEPAHSVAGVVGELGEIGEVSEEELEDQDDNEVKDEDADRGDLQDGETGESGE